MELPWRVVVNQRQFLRQARILLVDPQHSAIGRVRRRSTRFAQELVLDRWQAESSVPNGLERPPMMDWAVVGAADAYAQSLETLVLAVRPKQSQLLVVILLDRRRHQHFSVAVWQNGSLQYPEEVRFIGSQMIRIKARETTSALTKTQTTAGTSHKLNHDVLNTTPGSPASLRSSRTLGALGPLYGRLADMHVVQVGAGGGGQELARQLIASGVRRLTIIDGDTLGVENLDRMPLAKASQVGQPKVLQLARSLHENQPDASISILPKSVLHGDVTRYLRSMRSDVLFSYVDSNVARLAVSLQAREMEAVHIDVGSTVQYEAGHRIMAGDVRLFEPRVGCIACVPQMENLDHMLYHLSAPSGSLQRGRPLRWDEQRAGSLLHLNSLVSGIAVEHWLAWLSGEITTSHWTRVRWFGVAPQIQSASVGSAGGCRFCDPENTLSSH